MLIEKIWANLFCLFFTAQILSPMIDGKTIYLEIVFALLNPLYIGWLLLNVKLKLPYIMVAFSILLFCLCGHAETGIKFVLIIFEVTCLMYMNKRKILYLKQYFLISFIFLVAQQVFLLLDPAMAILIGSQNIAKTIWGSYSTSAFTNYYALVEFGIPRTSGLSREAGFFASYMAVMFLNEYCYQKESGVKINLLGKVVYLSAYVFSFSKISIGLILQILIIKFRNIIKEIPYFVVVILFYVIVTIISICNYDYILMPENITFLHRFGAYITIFDVSFYDLLFGVDLNGLPSAFRVPIELDGLKVFAGFAGFILENGLVSVSFMFITIYVLGINSLGILMLLVSTLTTSPDTMQNFIILQYYVLFRYRMFRHAYPVI